jgi:hypothetical protein
MALSRAAASYCYKPRRCSTAASMSKGDQATGVAILRKALEGPLRQTTEAVITQIPEKRDGGVCPAACRPT